jgi:hypothetical protein
VIPESMNRCGDQTNERDAIRKTTRIFAREGRAAIRTRFSRALGARARGSFGHVLDDQNHGLVLVLVANVNHAQAAAGAEGHRVAGVLAVDAEHDCRRVSGRPVRPLEREGEAHPGLPAATNVDFAATASLPSLSLLRKSGRRDLNSGPLVPQTRRIRERTRARVRKPLG